jgi:hypothetical protein
MRTLLSASVLRDHEAHIAYMTAVAQRQAMSKMRINILDRFLQSRIEHASQRMQAALGDALALADLPVIPDTTDPAPFALRRRVAGETLARLEYQITYLKQWHERLSGVPKSARSYPGTPANNVIALRKDVISLRARLTSERRTG